MHYLFLCLALASSVSIALLLRMFEHKGVNRTVIISSNYILAVTLSYFLSDKPTTDTAVYIFGALLGLFFFTAFVLYSKAIKQKGIAGTVTISRLSLAIPVVLSILLWGETPNITDILALLLIFSIILTWEGKIGTFSPILLSLFLLFGVIDAAIKFFKFKFPTVDDSFFMIITFGSALVWSWLYLLVIRQKVKAADVGRGLMLGLPNYCAFFFRLKALETIPAYVTFPFVNIGLIIVSALMGYLLFKEKVSRKKMLLILLGIIAVLLLTTPVTR